MVDDGDRARKVPVSLGKTALGARSCHALASCGCWNREPETGTSDNIMRAELCPLKFI